MPFDGLPLLDDIARLRVALDGVRNGWTTHAVGGQGDTEHCAIGWLLVATDWDRDEAVRLALDYVYPALPPGARHRSKGRLECIWSYNDRVTQDSVEQLFSNAVALASVR